MLNNGWRLCHSYSRENNGKTSGDLVVKWNEQYPEDQVTFSQN